MSGLTVRRQHFAPADWQERERERKERALSGYTSLRVTNATRAKLAELLDVVGPLEVRGADELLHALLVDEIARRRA